MNFTKIADNNPELVDGKVVLFMYVDSDDGKYDFAPGFRKNNQYFYPDNWPMPIEMKPVEWTSLPKLPPGCLYTWECSID